VPITRGGLPQPIPVKKLASDPAGAANKAFLYARQRGTLDAILECVRPDGRRAVLSAYGDLTAGQGFSGNLETWTIFLAEALAAGPGKLEFEWSGEVTVAGSVATLRLGLGDVSPSARGSIIRRTFSDGTGDVLTAAAMNIAQLRASTDGPRLVGRVSILWLPPDGGTNPQIAGLYRALTVCKTNANTYEIPLSIQEATGYFRLYATGMTGLSLSTNTTLRPWITARTKGRLRLVG
jgi:hypothetical protein